MSWKVTIVLRTLHFREPAGTSRGVYLTHDVWYVVLEDKEGRFGEPGSRSGLRGKAP